MLHLETLDIQGFEKVTRKGILGNSDITLKNSHIGNASCYGNNNTYSKM